MPRLLSERSRSYTPQGGTELSPGRPARLACGRCFGSALYGNMQGDRAGVSRGHSRRRTLPKGGMVTGNEPGKAGRSHPAEGPNPK
ncbi:MAG: hypothetical protein JRI53_01740 [Deltaproteobacteria bacterium]|nr:hypothetical protein [Deltaproteobacteria bacterium]